MPLQWRLEDVFSAALAGSRAPSRNVKRQYRLCGGVYWAAVVRGIMSSEMARRLAFGVLMGAIPTNYLCMMTLVNSRIVQKVFQSYESRPAQ